VYLVVYNSKVVGQTAEGVVFDRTVFKQMITGDWMGQAPQDGINQGTELTSMLDLLEYDAPAVVDLIRPYNGTNVDIRAGMVGTLDVYHQIAKSMVLTGLLTATNITANGGTGSSVTPLTRTLPRTILHENYPVREAFSSRLRNLPVRLRHYPSPHTQATGVGGGVFGTET
jgi:hypothetical protein